MRRRTRALSLSLVTAVAMTGALVGPSHSEALGSEASSSQVAPGDEIVLPSKDPFYTWDEAKPLEDFPRGAVLRTREVMVGVPSSNQGMVPATQILYRTQDQRRRPSATVTTVVNPTAPLNAGLVAYLSFYDALGDICSPSYTLQGGDPGAENMELTVAETAIVTSLAAQGYAVTVPDFEGVDLHWVAGQESGWSTLDSIRATIDHFGMAEDQPVGMVGYSGGSIGAEWAAELAPTYAPELNIVGTAVGGVPVHLAHNLNYINGSETWSGVIPAVLVSLGRAFDIPMGKYKSAKGKRITKEVRRQCIGSFNGNYPGLKVESLMKKPYKAFLKVPRFARVVNKLIMGSTPGRPQHPMLIRGGNVDGTGDDVMIADDMEALAHQYCGQGLAVDFGEVDGAAHTEAALQFFPEAFEFLQERFVGAPFAGNCDEIGPGNSLDPLPVGKKPIRK